MIFKLLAIILVSMFLYNSCFKLWYKIYFYKKQGVTILPGCWRPIIGNLLELSKYHDFASKSEDPLTFPLCWVS